MTVEELRAQIRAELPVGIQALAALLRDDNTSAGNKIKAFQALADRGGIPEMKATITQTISAKVSIEELESERTSLLVEQEAISTQLKELKAGGVEEARQNRDAILPQPQQKG